MTLIQITRHFRQTHAHSRVYVWIFTPWIVLVRFFNLSPLVSFLYLSDFIEQIDRDKHGVDG